ncbi:MAG: hypothetical protein JXM73_18520, partial [Anaerolineae bacterium]|nr:hypothetical protein [Anaerolineae bacterium]
MLFHRLTHWMLAASMLLQTLGGSATFRLAMAQQGANPITLTAAGAPADAGNNGWQTRDNIVLRRRPAGLYEIAALQPDGIELAYLLTEALPDATPGDDLALVVSIDSDLQPYQSEAGLFLLDESGNGLRIGDAKAIDANGSETPVAIVPIDGATVLPADQSPITQPPNRTMLRLVIPADWLVHATYPILVDPYVTRWEADLTLGTERSPAIAYDLQHNQALVAYTGGSGLFVQLVSAIDGTLIHDAQLDAATCTTDPSMTFGFAQAGGQNEYLVVCGQGTDVVYWRVDTNGYQVGDKITLGTVPLQAKTVDIASAGNNAALVVWSDDSQARGLHISLDGTPQGRPFPIPPPFSNRNAAVTYDASLEAYVVVWQHGSEIFATTVSPGGLPADAFQVSEAPGLESWPDVAYSGHNGQTLVVWSSASEVDGKQDIQARRLSGGVPVTPIIVVAQTDTSNCFPHVAGNHSIGWAVTWERITGAEDDIRLALVRGNAIGNLTSLNKTIGQTTAGEVHPSVAVRGDGVPMVAFEDRGNWLENSEIVLVIYSQDPLVSFSWHYQYDALGRVISVCSNWENGECLNDQWQYRQDGAGNLLLFNHWDADPTERKTVTSQYVINGANQIECIDT